MKNLKKPNIPFPCKYHEKVYLTPSAECKDSYVCSQCKLEKKIGRDGIYGIVEIMQLIEDSMLAGIQTGKTKIIIIDECLPLWERDSK